MVETRRRDERRGVLSAPQPRPSAVTSQRPSAPPVTQEQVSLSLVDIVEELANHVPAEKRPQVELLRRLAWEKPDQHVKVKEQMLIVGGVDAIRAAVQAVLSSGRTKSPSPPPPPPPLPPQPVWSAQGAEPPMPANLPAIFGSTASSAHELQTFKAELVHAFHCGGCSTLSQKLVRLHQHVASCQVEDKNACLLCSINGYLKSFTPAETDESTDLGAAAQGLSAEGLGSAAFGGSSSMPLMYADELLASQQLLPCWDRERGRLSWMPPQDALASVRSLTPASNGGAGGGLPSRGGLLGGGSTARVGAAPAAASSGSSAKRMRSAGGGALSALEAYPGLQQGVLQASPLWGGNPGHAERLGTPAMPRVATASAPAPSAAPISLPLPGDGGVDFAAMTMEMYGAHSGSGHTRSKRSASAAFDPFAKAFGSLSPRRSDRGGGMMPAMPLDKSRSFNISGNLNLGEMLKSTSLTDLGLGGALGDLPSMLGFSFSKETRAANESELSLSGLLGESASDLFVNGSFADPLSLTISPRQTHRSARDSGLLGGGLAPVKSNKKQELLDIMNDFGAGPMLQPIKS